MQHNGSGVFKAVGIVGINTMLDQFPHKPPIQLGHFKTVQCAVYPVEFPPYPVDCKPFAVYDPVDNHLSVTAVKVHPLYNSPAHINPIEALVDTIKVEGNHTVHVLQDQRVRLTVRRQVPQVVAVAEDEVRGDVAVLTASVAVRLPQVTRGTLAHVGSYSVFAHLAAHTRSLFTLVHIVASLAVRHEAVAQATSAEKPRGCVGAVVITVVS